MIYNCWFCDIYPVEILSKLDYNLQGWEMCQEVQLNSISSHIITHRPKQKSGFSLVELMIVIVLIGVLAAIGVPIYSYNVQKVVRAEGEAALGSIRTQVQIYYAEYGYYPIETLDRIVSQEWHQIDPRELRGNHFNDSSYYYQGDGETYLIGLHRGDVLDLHRSLNQNGVFEDWDVNVNE